VAGRGQSSYTEKAGQAEGKREQAEGKREQAEGEVTFPRNLENRFSSAKSTSRKVALPPKKPLVPLLVKDTCERLMAQ
jgi:hypothetical protein